MSAPDTPQQADPVAAAIEEGNQSRQTAVFNTNLGMVDQVTPNGTISYTLKEGADPANPQPGDYTATTSLSPYQQTIADQYGGVLGEAIDRVEETQLTPLADQFTPYTNPLAGFTPGEVALYQQNHGGATQSTFAAPVTSVSGGGQSTIDTSSMPSLSGIDGATVPQLVGMDQSKMPTLTGLTGAIPQWTGVDMENIPQLQNLPEGSQGTLQGYTGTVPQLSGLSGEARPQLQGMDLGQLQQLAQFNPALLQQLNTTAPTAQALNTKLDTSGVGDITRVDYGAKDVFNTALINTPEYQLQEAAARQIAGPAGAIRDTFDTSGVRALPGTIDDTSRRRVEEALFARLNPMLQKEEDNTRNNLLNAGMEIGTDGYNRELDRLARARNDARLATIAQAGQEESRQVGLTRDLNAQEFAQAYAKGQFGQAADAGNNTAALNVVNANNASALNYYNSINDMGMKGNKFNFDQDVAARSFQNSNIQGNLDNRISVAGANNAAQNQAYNQALSTGNFSNSAIQNNNVNAFNTWAGQNLAINTNNTNNLGVFNANNAAIKGNNDNVFGVNNFNNAAIQGNFNNDVTAQNLANTATQGNFNNDLTAQKFSNDAIQGNFDNSITAGNFANNVIQGNFDNSVTGVGVNNLATQNNFDNSVTGLNLSNAAAQGNFNNYITGQNLSNTATQGNFNNSITTQELYNTAQQGNFNNLLAATGFNNDASTTNFNNELAAGQFANNAYNDTVQQQLEADRLNQQNAQAVIDALNATATTAGNLGEQQFAQESYLANLPYQQYATLAGANPVTLPQPVATNTGAAQTPDILAATGMANNAANQQYQAQMGGYNSTLGLAGTLGAAAIMSDIRLKTNIQYLGEHPSGVGRYSWDWRDGSGSSSGVIAQELQAVHPEAVEMQPSGYLAVHYDLIGGK